MNNAERLKKHIAENGVESSTIMIVQKDKLWLVIQKIKKNAILYRVILCDPNKTTWRIIHKGLPMPQILTLYLKILNQKMSNKFRENTEIFRKHFNQIIIN